MHEQDAQDSNRPDYVLPEREELERITPKIERALESMLDEEEKVGASVLGEEWGVEERGGGDAVRYG